jgi:hypothetical protein
LVELKVGHEEHNTDLENGNGLNQPLLLDAKERDNEDIEECDDSEEASTDSWRPASSIGEAYRLLTPSVKVQSNILLLLFHFGTISCAPKMHA